MRAIDYLDGVTIQYPDWWMNVRPSNTEPLLRLNVEGDTRELMERHRDEALAIIREPSGEVIGRGLGRGSPVQPKYAGRADEVAARRRLHLLDPMFSVPRDSR